LSRTIATLGLVLLLATAGSSEVVTLTEGAAALSVHAAGSRSGSTVIDYELGSFTLDAVSIDGREYQRVLLGDESVPLKRGMPALPNVSRSVVIPDDRRVSVRVLYSHYVDFPGIDVAASKGEIERSVDPRAVPYEFDAFYESGGWYPADIASIRSPYILRDVRGVVVVVNPFQYDPDTRILRVYDRVTVEVVPDGPAEVNVLSSRPPSGRVRDFEKLYERHFLNYDRELHGVGAARRGSRYTSLGEAGSILVISYGSFMSAMEPFVEWKNQLGVPCEMVDLVTAGVTAPGIRDYIQEYYDSHGVTFVLLVGDADQIPTLTANGGTSDPSFSLVAGDDYYPDIFVGRFSAENAVQVQTQVQRSIEYEKEPQSGADWYHMGTGIASNQGPGDDGEYDNEHVDNLRDDLLAFTYTSVDQIYDPGANPTMVANALNEGRGIINYTGHGSCLGWGSSDFANSDVNALTNDNALPFIWSVACSNGNFAYAYAPCFAEAWLRATNGLEPTGAIAALMSSISQDWDEPMDAQDEMVDLLVAGAKRTYGALSMNGVCHMLDEYGAAGHDDFLAWHIFGDPSLRVRTATPAAISVEHDPVVSPSDTTFDVRVDGVEGALCSFYRDGEFYGSGMTDASGDAVIDIEGVLPATESVTLTVTAFNAIPYFGSVDVSEAYAAIVDVDPSFYNVDLEPGEAKTDTLSIRNEGEPLSVLYYDIDVTGAGMARGDDLSGISVEPDECDPGATLDLVFTIANDCSDGEWVNAASLSFPAGVNVNSATDFSVADRALIWDGTVGNGATVGWDGSWWNVLRPGEAATATVNVTVDPGFDGNVSVLYGIDGDGHGDAPHAMSGALTIDCGAEVLHTLLSPNGSESWGIGEEHTITWTPSGAPLLVDLDVRIDGGDWTTIVENTEDDGSYEWNVDAHASDNCLVRVALSVDPEVYDTSDGSFSIYQPVDWLSVSPTEGTVLAGERIDVEVDVDAAGVPEGEYFADIVVVSNGGDPVVVPVTLTVGSTGADDRVPSEAVSYGNYPNPFRPTTRIAFSVPRTTLVTARVYSVDGRLVRTLAEERTYGAGRHTVRWDGRTGDGDPAPTGVYFFVLKAGNQELSGKMLLLR